MDQTRDPGITIEKVNLIECTARVLDPDARLAFNLALVELTRSEEGDLLVVAAKFDLMHEIEKPACLLQCSFVAAYARTEGSNMQWAEFSDAMAVMHMIPYVREFVSSVTLRMPIRELILPPTNVHFLLSRYHSRQSDKAAPQAAG